MSATQLKPHTRTRLLRAAAFLPAAGWYAVIFAFSAQTGAESSQLSGAVVSQSVDWMGDWGAIFRMDWNALQFLSFLVRKAAHMAAYFILAGLLLFALWRLIHRPLPRAAAALGLCAVLAGLDELHQRFVPGREGKLADVLIDLGGALLFLLLWHLIAWLRARGKAKRSHPVTT